MVNPESGLELDDRRQRIGKGTNPSLRTAQNTGLATARADLTRKEDESAVARSFRLGVKGGLALALVVAGYLGYDYREKMQEEAFKLKTAEEEKAKEDARVIENAPECFTANSGHYFRFKMGKKWKEVRTIEQVPLKKRRGAQYLRVLK